MIGGGGGGGQSRINVQLIIFHGNKRRMKVGMSVQKIVVVSRAATFRNDPKSQHNLWCHIIFFDSNSHP